MHDEVENLLIERRTHTVVYVPNSGNAGDAFIAHATYQLFNRIGLEIEIGHLDRVYPNRIVVCGGGGNLVGYYRDMIDFIARNHAFCRELIVLPHTIRAYVDVLGELEANAYIFCREAPSFEFVQRAAPRANVALSHDLAFGCDLANTRRQAHWLWPYTVGRLARHPRLTAGRWLLQQIETRVVVLGGAQGVLNAFRTDTERTDVAIPPDNVDVSRVFAGGSLSPQEALMATYRMMRFLGQFKLVRTNRLHVAIMTALLGLEVDLYDNSYGKSCDVYVHSMRDRFANVHWRGAT